MSEKVTGPASYFPSIERNYGRPIAEWKEAMRASGLQTNKQLVDWLKAEHRFGHGHAAAITHHFLNEGTQRGSADDLVAKPFTAKKAHWRPVYDQLAAGIESLGEVKVLPKQTLVGFGTKVQFVMLQPSTPTRFDVGLKLPGEPFTERLEAAGSWNTMMAHRVQLSAASDVDAELLAWISQAHQRSLG
ncbi:MAG: DUF4287 domain-containing protein [Ilumatobacteraceae bacterium]